MQLGFSDKLHPAFGLSDLAMTPSLENLPQGAELLSIMSAVLGGALWIASPSDNRILWASGNYRQIFEKEGATLLSDPPAWLGTVHPQDFKRVSDLLSDAVEGNAVTDEFRILRLDGSVKWIHIRAFSVSQLVISFAEDITARKEAEEESVAREVDYRKDLLEMERTAREASERANKLKDEFLATVSHELRTPLNSILGWAQLLRTGRLGPEESKKGADAIANSARSQAQLINDLLDISRIVSGKLKVQSGEVNLLNVVETALDMIRPAAQGKGVTLEKFVDTSVLPVMGEAARLQQVVWNLLSNAVKFTGEGGTVTVEIIRSGPVNHIIVRDTGAGISPGFLPHIFDRFRQADSSSTRRFSGLGVGLAITRALVELHGGTLTAESDGEGMGSSFTVSLPVSVAPPLFAQAARPLESVRRSAVASLRGITVLVVDDDQSSREIISRLLRESSAKVVAACSTKEAYRLLSAGKVDVLLSDIGMPGEDGYSFIRKVRALSDGCGLVPAGALTAFTREEDCAKALDAGFQTHIAKPVEPAELIAAVAALAGRAR